MSTKHSIIRAWSSIRRTIPLIVLIPMLIGIGLTWYLTNHHHNTTLQDIGTQFQIEESERLQRDISVRLSSLQKMADIFEFNHNHAIGAEEPLGVRNSLLVAQINSYPSIEKIHYMSRLGDVWGVERNGENIVLVEERTIAGDPEGESSSKREEWIVSPNSGLVRAQKGISSLRHSSASQVWSRIQQQKSVWRTGAGEAGPLLQFIQRFDNAEGKLVGVLVIEQNLRGYNSMVERYLWSDEEAFVVELSPSEEANLIAISQKTHRYDTSSGRYTALPETVSFVDDFNQMLSSDALQLQQIPKGDMILRQWGNNSERLQFLIFSVPQNLADPWYGVVVFPQNVFLQNNRLNRQSMALLVLTGLLLMTWVAIRMSRHIVEPVLGLSNAALGIRTQKFDPRDVGIIAQRNDEFGDLARSFNEMASVLIAREQDLQRLVEERTRQIQEQNQEIQRKSEENEHLLLNILPRPIARRLQTGENNISDSFEQVSVLFSDLVGFTRLSSTMSSSELVRMLNGIFSRFDALCLQYGVEKIKTIGDGYLVASGLPKKREDHAEAIAMVALKMLQHLKEFNEEHNHSLELRIGLHSGPVTAGVIGTHKFIYDLWGDTVNIASRMESNGESNQIHVSDVTKLLLQDKFVLEERGEIDVKGKGIMNTFWLLEPKEGAVLPEASTEVEVTSSLEAVATVRPLEISAESSWGEILNSKVSMQSLRALLTKDLFAKERNLSAEGLDEREYSPEELQEMSWTEFLSQDVTMQSLKVLFTKDLQGAKSKKEPMGEDRES